MVLDSPSYASNIQSSRTISPDVSLLNHGLSECVLVFGIVTNVQVFPLAVFELIHTVIIFHPNLNMEKNHRLQKLKLNVFAN